MWLDCREVEEFGNGFLDEVSLESEFRKVI